MGLESAFDLGWAGFVGEWCLGVTPGFTEANAERAISALERHWPERIQGVKMPRTRGVSAMGDLVTEGSILARCEGLTGFLTVAARLRAGELASLAELRFAATLVRLGWDPELEPELDGKHPDARIAVDGQPVYCEVIAPEQSAALRILQAEMLALAEGVASDNLGCRIEVLWAGDTIGATAANFRQEVRALPCSQELPTSIGGHTVRKQGRSAALLPGLPPLHPGLPYFGLGHATNAGGVNTEVHAYSLFTDERAAGLMEAESKHFSQAYPNLLVIDVSGVHNGLAGFPPLISRRLQPTMNRRFSCVLLYHRWGLMGTGVSQVQFHLIENPHAYIPLPGRFLDALRRLASRSQAAN